jgi:hypothetical protein
MKTTAQITASNTYVPFVSRLLKTLLKSAAPIIFAQSVKKNALKYPLKITPALYAIDLSTNT